ncbi:MAG: hypothetical protein DHS20C01_31180 [marine bacterium B5-7]|nr:MAG: hypothetical protein DHS20C01_31180 [marine bacterium B5-7]
MTTHIKPTKTLLEPVTSYPVFVGNQLLSSSDLNDVVAYLDQQARLTRLGLIGAGIVCGLGPRMQGNTLVISSGCGVTSGGFLIHLDVCQLKYYLKVKLSRTRFLRSDAVSEDEIDAFELFETEQEASITLSALFAESKVVVLLLEYMDDKNESCLDDCDEKGMRRVFKMRKFLIDSALARELIEENYNPQNDDGGTPRFPGWALDDLLIGKYGLADLYLERFGYTAKDGEQPALAELTTIKSYEMFLERYKAIITEGAKRVADALKRTHIMFSPLFSRYSPSKQLDLPLERFESARERPFEIQYLYDHLSDLILAYDEFREVSFDLMDVCRADAGWFPMHLFLGKPLPGTNELTIPPTVDRTPYAQPPVYNGNWSRTDAARLLYKRLELLIDKFSVPPVSLEDDALRITPSRFGKMSLSARAIPYYYDPTDLHRTWNSDRHRKNRDHQTHTYYRLRAPDGGANSPYDDPLVFDFEGHDFFRIEGHVGRDLSSAFYRIQKLRGHYNLPFDIVVLKLGEEINDQTVEHDCEIEILEALYVKLRTDLQCALEQWPDYQADRLADDDINALLGKLTEKLDDFDYDKFIVDFDKVVKIVHCEEEAKQCLLGYDKLAFKQLYDLHDTRKEAVKGQHLFHKFAESHPGMEHKAGVPRGGTFILVYHEWTLTEARLDKEIQLLIEVISKHSDFTWLRGANEEDVEERVREIVEKRGLIRHTVVGDFCLPYLCCSNCPPTAYVIARPRPTLALNPNSFCANDMAKYDFILDPPGGVLTGLGTQQEGVRYFFVPKDTQYEQGLVEVTYSVDGAEAKLLLAILPVPQATFTVNDGICPNDGLVPLELNKDTLVGGEFTTDIDLDNPGLGIVKIEGGYYFDPRAESVPREETICITYTVQSDKGCTGLSKQNTWVNEAPNADFTGLEETYCSNGGRTKLKPVDTNLSSSVFNGGDGVCSSGGDIFFAPGDLEFEDDQITVEVAHSVKDSSGCSAELPKSTTVYRVPQEVVFSIEPLQAIRDKFRFKISGIQPKQSEDGPFHYMFDWDNGHTERQNSQDFTLEIPKTDLENQNSLTLKLVVFNGPCEGSEFEAESEIIREQEDSLGDNTIPDDVLVFFRQRHNQNFKQLTDIAELHEGIKQTKPFQLAEALIKAVPDRSTDDLVADYEKLAGTFVRAYRRATGDRKAAYTSLAETATLALFDRIVAQPGSEAARERALKQLAKIREAGVDLEMLYGAWLTPALKNVLDAAQIDNVRSLIE